MTATYIIIGIASIVVISIMVIYISQAREKARIERFRLVTSLQDRHRRMHRMLAELPGQYQTRDLQLLLVDCALEALHQLKEVRADGDIDGLIKRDGELKATILKDGLKPEPMRIDSAEKLKEILQQIESMYRFLETLAQRGGDVTAIRQSMAYLGYLVHRVKADLLVHRSDEADKEKKPRVAIHNLHLAVEELMKCKNAPPAIAAINQYRTRIKALEKLAEGDAADENARQRNEAKINQEWEKFSDKDEAWKKRADYDS